jgi:putative DNA primase/helicase
MQAVWDELHSLAQTVDSGTLSQVFTFAKSTSSAHGQEAMLRMARRDPTVLIEAAKLDADPWVLNCENGTVDLRTGELRPHRREDFITKLCPVVYDPGATCPVWERFLCEVMGGNEDLVMFLQRAVGMSLSGKILDHVILILHGTGRNGKSTFLNAVQGVIGRDYAMKAPPEMLMTRRGVTHPTERADLFGKRFVSCIEAEPGAKMAEALVKELTGGDAIRARFMHRDFFEFEPTHHIWLACNHKPSIRGTDDGIWRRIRLVPFDVAIAEEKQDRTLPDKLLAEKVGILAWGVRGAMTWGRNGLGHPPKVRQATAEYRTQEDTFATFLDQCCVVGDECRVKAKDLYEVYFQWCNQMGEYPVSKRRLGHALEERGYGYLRSDGTWYTGVGLLANGA